ncbi:MAG: TonB-dependent receptor [Acidobacteriota bacterium]|nr:TonB-dependent receptor [Acidobacteriota bacterium]
MQPGFNLGGYLIKDRLWVFVGAAPEYQQFARTVNFAASSGAPGARTFHENVNTYYSNARLDFLATSKIRLFSSWTYQYQRGTGTSLPGADDAFGQFNPSSTTSPDNFNGGIGYVAPNVIYNVGADITLTPHLVATTRFGYFHQNYEDRGIPSGIRYIYRDTNYPYATGNAPAPAGTKALDGTLLPSQFVNSAGFSNLGANAQTVFDVFNRFSFNQDIAYFKKGFGTHNFKFGYAFNRGTNDVLNGYNTADVYVGYNVQYGPFTSNGISRCQAIIAQNLSRYGQSGGAADGSACQGLYGTVNLRDLGTTGKVGGMNHAFYIQDAWTVGRRLTLNLGVRLDKENLPSYDTLPGFQGISFGWGQKVAPRLGAAYDLLGNGKVKVFGSFGYFFDIMKYQLPRGSFGGDYWHDCVYALDTPDFNTIIPQRDSNGHYCPTGGGSTPAVGSLPTGLRFIENVDFREPANDPNQIGTLGKTGLVDPNLLPMKQHEMVIGADWAISPSLALETRYSRKRLDRTIEDTGTITQDGEVYYISNPGFSVNKTVPNCNGCPANPKAIRNYDGLEVRLNKRAGKFYGSFSYTYSRFYGNYSGLTATDISDGIGRNGANTDRAFDEPFMSFDAHGKPINGPLPTDRPHTVKAYAYYNLKWWKFNTMIGGYQQIYSGTPLTSYISVWGAPVFVEGRGKVVDVTRDPATGNWIAGNVHDQRSPSFSQSDLSVSQEFHLSKSNEKLKARVGGECNNCLNQHAPVFFNHNLIRSSGLNPAACGTVGTNCTPTEANQAGFDYGVLLSKGFDYIGAANSQSRTLNSQYGQPFGWQNRRSLRFQINFVF